MRHGKKFNHLGRKKGHREAMLMNMACSLIEHKRINTTVAKAKALRKFVEPLINRSKEDSTHSRRMVFRYLQSKDAVNELFREVAPKVADRPGGYTRILKTGQRLGDAADMCFIELVDYNENMLKDPKTSKKKRSRRSGKKGGEAPSADATTEKTTTTEAKDSAVEDAVIVEEVAADTVAQVADATEKEEAKAVVEEKVEAGAKPVAESETETVAEAVDKVEEIRSETTEEEVKSEKEPEASDDEEGEENASTDKEDKKD